MPGKKRKADSSSSMWGSSSSNSSSPSSSRRSSSNKQSSSSRRGGGGGGGGAQGSGAYPYINEEGASKLFEEICDEDDPNVAGMEGICKLCEQLNLDPLEDIRVLVLLYKLGANKKPAEISKEEWMTGCNKHRLDSIDKFTNFLPALDTGFMERDEFKEFYKFCFQFNRQGTHKTLEKDLVVALLKMCLNNDRITTYRLDTFCDFLETTKDESYSKITLDQWRSFLDFSQEFPDEGSLMGYDESESAWPVLIDEYVEFMEKKAKK
mmetsp:Transcript_27525/g.39428  ORF Transcript_27525/g.39428 Transcript_27525/m.39428 type:complete len:265 (-) Transcript_27525:142-936(-)|eukprot:CAMPEP_0201688926 /NCGR_PEP_ID=MMETSP0578-20130828/2593_1 /ASSEMBLY_ACC=CAM_ASM_000663 /TAXON_ID=267565 /ORGANISM="Skeletonema grethea, Strain CCMP 1804" /LENGTH=264 /DNA_ID=CAMNT_0048173405 /DNA_START=123 /DNA_END=917 /DNA_ORIENTATION=-